MGAIEEPLTTLYESDFADRAFEQAAAVERRDWQAVDIADHIADNPSLKPYLAEVIARAWRSARLMVVGETGLPIETFPEQCPYSWEQAMAPDSGDV